MDTTGIPADHTQCQYSNWSVSEDVKQRDVKQREQFSRTEKFEELLLAWMRAGLEHSSFSIRL